jgi:D-alanyl-D-alanine carboxypeptidase
MIGLLAVRVFVRISMNDRPFLTARIDADHVPTDWSDHSCVPWWSFTKTALATAALQLVDGGYLDLDDRIDDRLYTLRQLLQHRAGVPNYGGLASYHDAVARGEKPWDVAQMLNRVRVDHLDYEPGCGWNYSNVGYYFVRLKIEQVTSQDIGSALRQLVFDPLGLASVRLVPTVEDFAGTEWGNRSRYDPGWVYHGLLAGTPGDAVRFLHKLMSGDVLRPDLLAEAITPHPVGGPWPDRPWRKGSYGLGLMIAESSAGTAIGHSGSGPGSVAAVYHFPDLALPCTVGVFAQGEEGEDRPSDQGLVEQEAVRLALSE